MPFTENELLSNGRIVSIRPEEKAYIQARLEGEGERDAIKQTGASVSRLSGLQADGTILDYLRERMIEQGITDDLIAQRLFEGLSAMRRVKVKKKEKEGPEHEDVADVNARGKYIDRILEITGITRRAQVAATASLNISVTNEQFVTVEDTQGTEEEVIRKMIERSKAVRQNSKRSQMSAAIQKAAEDSDEDSGDGTFVQDGVESRVVAEAELDEYLKGVE